MKVFLTADFYWRAHFSLTRTSSSLCIQSCGAFRVRAAVVRLRSALLLLRSLLLRRSALLWCAYGPRCCGAFRVSAAVVRLRSALLCVHLHVIAIGAHLVDCQHSGNMKCFECGDVGHKRIACPHRRQVAEAAPSAVAASHVSPEEPIGSASAVRVAPEEPVGSAAAVRVAPEGPAGSILDCVRAGQEVALTAESQIVTELPKEDSSINSVDMDCDSDGVSVTDSITDGAELYSLNEINLFLDDTFGKAASVFEYFPDGKKFIETVNTLQRVVGLDLLDERKRFRLKRREMAWLDRLWRSGISEFAYMLRVAFLQQDGHVIDDVDEDIDIDDFDDNGDINNNRVDYYIGNNNENEEDVSGEVEVDQHVEEEDFLSAGSREDGQDAEGFRRGEENDDTSNSDYLLVLDD
ncbi:Homeobox goosecoid [Solea senegalensis]|uniref:Homeobox goosecoid n=1 Tax=Solea senegalensis TaxID=28829 RepID=A0AAV6QBN7_SOLSE|nr:Homeobox goosecoid [Solea senegalensis]